MVEKIVAAIVSALLSWLESRVSRPTTIENVETSKDLRDRWRTYLDKQLSDQGGAGGQPK